MTDLESASWATATLIGMEAASRWETEAIREARDRRRARPTVSQQSRTPNPTGDWRTLREASDETGIPVGTLRKWCRRETVDSYLEFDGEQTLRMLEMGSVERNAKAMGRDIGEPRAQSQEPREERPAAESRQSPVASPQPETPADPVPGTQYSVPSTADEVGDPSTMIVPVDAWNKMLTQLGNLHEAGQQLAEARERAGKAETEVKFLRERLVLIRQETRDSRLETGPTLVAPAEGAPSSVAASSSSPSASSSSPSGGGGSATGADGGGQSVPSEATTDPNPVPSAEGRGDAEHRDAGGQQPVETTSFWRYVVRGWRGRKR
jgi:hypothetical protein